MFALAGALVAALPGDALACAGCSNPNLPTARATGVRVRAGEWSTALSLTGTAIRVVHESACPDIGPVCRLVEVEPYLHDQALQVGELRGVLELGLTDAWGIQLQLPLKLIHTTILYRRLDGTIFEPDHPTTHHRNETLVGLTDPWLSGRVAASIGTWSLVGRVGVSLPLGRTEPNPFQLGDAGEPHQHFQFGTGTFNSLLAAEFLKPLGDFQASGYVQAQLVPSANARGFQAGHRLGLGALVGRSVAGELRATIGVDVVHEEAERWGGAVQQDGNLGRTDVLAGLGFSYPLGEQTLSASARVPVYQRVLGGQLSYPALVTVGLERSWGGALKGGER